LTPGAVPTTMAVKCVRARVDALEMPLIAMNRSAALMVLAAVALAAPAKAEVESTPVVTSRSRATLVAGGPAAVPGAPLPVALHLQLKPGWHTYWRNPGDSGEPASVTLRVAGQEVKGPDTWPTPERIDIAGIVSYGHHGDVMLVTTVPIPAATGAGAPLRVEAEAAWLVCEKVCVPENGRFTLEVPVAATRAPAGEGGRRSLYPSPLPAITGLFASAGKGWELRLPATSLGPGEGAVVDAYFFPERGDLIDHSAPQELREWAGQMALGLASAQPPADPPSELRGVLAITRQRPDGSRQTVSFNLAARAATESR
jgi:thiol:disulfide interchange protein DsbD